jgi:branched-chain amino acid transport system substrate-binding protein
MGVQQAIDDINARGGVLGQKLSIVIADDSIDRDKAVAVANDFVRQGVKFVVGHQTSEAAIFAAPIYMSAGVIEISPGSTNPLLTEQGFWNVFRVIGRDDDQGVAAADFIARRYSDKTLALLHDQWPYGKLIFNKAVRELKAKNFNLVTKFDVDDTNLDAQAVVAQIIRSKADVVYWAGMPAGFAQILKEARAKGVDAIFLGPDSLALPDFKSRAGVALDNVLLTYAGDPRHKAAAQHVDDEMSSKGFAPIGYTLYAYAAVQVIQEAAAAARSLDPHKVAAALHGGRPFDTVLGPLRFDAKGDRADPDFVWYQYHLNGSGAAISPLSN